MVAFQHTLLDFRKVETIPEKSESTAEDKTEESTEEKPVEAPPTEEVITGMLDVFGKPS